MPDELFLDPTKLENVKRRNDGSIKAACPACRAADSDKSGQHLFIQSGGKFGCAKHPNDAAHRKEIFRLAGIRVSSGTPKPPNGDAPDRKSKFVCAYDYRDANENVIFQVIRFQNPKTFRQRKPDGKGDWIWKMDGVERVLFRLPEILRAVKNDYPIFICEGERDVQEMVHKGLDATCNPGGAGKWQDSFSETLRGANVTIIADKDSAGREHAALVSLKLHGIAKFVRVIELPDLNSKPVKDAADFFRRRRHSRSNHTDCGSSASVYAGG